jgi:kinetochore protein Nuf2
MHHTHQTTIPEKTKSTMDATTGPADRAYLFPVLRWSEILQCMSELGIELTKQDVQEPQHSKEKLRTVYLQLLEIGMGKTQEDLQVPPTGDNLTYPELHTDVSEFRLFRYLRELFQTCGYDDFSMRDLHCVAVTPKRLREQLSAFINLAKFREEQLQVYYELHESRNVLLQELHKTNDEHAVLDKEWAQAEQIAVENNDHVEQVLMECQELEVNIASQNKVQAAKRQEASMLKKRSNELKDEIANAEWALQELQAERDQIQAQVVTSPSRRQQQLEHRKHELHQQKENYNSMQQELQVCQVKTYNLQQATRDLKAAKANLDELQELANSLKLETQQYQNTLHLIQGNETEIADLQSASEEAQRTLQRVEEGIRGQRKQHGLQLQAMNEASDAAKARLLHVEKDRRTAMQKVDTSEQEVQEMELLMQRQREETTLEIQEMIVEYKETERVILERIRAQQEALQAATV